MVSHLISCTALVELFLPLRIATTAVFCYQATASDAENRHSDVNWLHHTLSALHPADSSDYDVENRLLTSLIARYEQLLLAVEVTTARSSVIVRCHEYNVSVERRVQWLTEMEDRMREDVPLDDVDCVRALLDEQQVSCLQLFALRCGINGQFNVCKHLSGWIRYDNYIHMLDPFPFLGGC